MYWFLDGAIGLKSLLLGVLWSLTTAPTAGQGITQMLASNEAVFVVSSDSLIARSLSSGNVMWRRTGIHVPADEAAGVIVASTDSGVAVLSAANGEERYRIDPCGHHEEPAVVATNGSSAVALCGWPYRDDTMRAVFIALRDGKIRAVRDTDMIPTNLPAWGQHFGANRYGAVSAADGAGGPVRSSAAFDLVHARVALLTLAEQREIRRMMTTSAGRWCKSGPPATVLDRLGYRVEACGGRGSPLQLRVIKADERR